MKTISIDADLENSDWIKQAWDLPPYKGRAFLELNPDLDHFRTTPVYQQAVKNGLIHDDEWVGDYTEPEKPQPKTKNIHIYIE